MPKSNAVETQAPALAETGLLLSAFRPEQTPESWEAERAQAGADWDRLVVRAIVFGLAPLFHHRVGEWGVAPPDRAAAKLRATYEAHAERNTAIYAQLADVLAACDLHNLRPIALKGVHLAAAVYRNPALRPMNDIDLLFTADELPAAEAVLTELGYRGKFKAADLGPGITKHTSTFRRDVGPGTTPNPYLSPDSEATVEPHSSLEESWFGLKVDITPGVRERSVKIALQGTPCSVLAGEDLLLHVCVHFCFHLVMGAPSLVQLTDLLAVTTAAGLHWSEVAKRATACGAAPYVLAALSLAQQLLAAPVPTECIRELEQRTPTALQRRIARLSLADILHRTQQPPLTSIPQRIRRGLSDRAEAARWAPDWRGRWQVWRTALAVGRSDTGRMLLAAAKGRDQTRHN